MFHALETARRLGQLIAESRATPPRVILPIMSIAFGVYSWVWTSPTSDASDELVYCAKAMGFDEAADPKGPLVGWGNI